MLNFANIEFPSIKVNLIKLISYESFSQRFMNKNYFSKKEN